MKTHAPYRRLLNLRLTQLINNPRLAAALSNTVEVKQERPIILPFPKPDNGPKRAA